MSFMPKMTPYLSLLGSETGACLHSCTCKHITENKESYMSGHHFVHEQGPPPQINKRVSKALKKQACCFIEETQDWIDRQDAMSEPCVAQQAEQAEDNSQKMRRHKRQSECNPILSPYFDKSDLNPSSPFGSDGGHLKSEAQSSFASDNLSTMSSNRGHKVRKLSESESFAASEIGMMKKASGMSNSSCSVATSCKDTFDHSSLLTKAYSLCEILNGRLLSTQVISGRGGNDGLSFECCNKHQFIISLSALHKLSSISIQSSVCYEIWCLKCRNFFRKIQEKARSMKSTIVSSCLSQGFIAVKCENNHQFNVPYTRNYSKTWCEECKNESIQRQKETYLKQEELENRRKQEEQQRIFEESQRYMEEQRLKESRVFLRQQEAERYSSILSQVCIFAKTKMESYMSRGSFKGNMTSVEVFNVYKIMYMPSEVLVKTLGMIEKDQLQSYYRKLALILHPDKNKHEQASDAFKKLTQAYEVYKN